MISPLHALLASYILVLKLILVLVLDRWNKFRQFVPLLTMPSVL